MAATLTAIAAAGSSAPQAAANFDSSRDDDSDDVLVADLKENGSSLLPSDAACERVLVLLRSFGLKVWPPTASGDAGSSLDTNTFGASGTEPSRDHCDARIDTLQRALSPLWLEWEWSYYIGCNSATASTAAGTPTLTPTPTPAMGAANTRRSLSSELVVPVGREAGQSVELDRPLAQVLQTCRLCGSLSRRFTNELQQLASDIACEFQCPVSYDAVQLGAEIGDALYTSPLATTPGVVELKIAAPVSIPPETAKQPIIDDHLRFRIVLFVSSACKPCHRLLEDVLPLWQTYYTQVELIVISVDNRFEQAEEYFRLLDSQFWNGIALGKQPPQPAAAASVRFFWAGESAGTCDGNPFTRQVGVTSVPVLFLIDSTTSVVVRRDRMLASELEMALEDRSTTSSERSTVIASQQLRARASRREPLSCDVRWTEQLSSTERQEALRELSTIASTNPYFAALDRRRCRVDTASGISKESYLQVQGIISRNSSKQLRAIVQHIPGAFGQVSVAK